MAVSQVPYTRQLKLDGAEGRGKNVTHLRRRQFVPNTLGPTFHVCLSTICNQIHDSRYRFATHACKYAGLNLPSLSRSRNGLGIGPCQKVMGWSWGF